MPLQFHQYLTAATLAVLMIAAPAAPAFAADSLYPTRPIRLVVSNAPGGGIDVAVRILAPKLTESMGQPWIIDNRAGASGNVGAETVARANPDGYTALACTSTLLTVNPSLFKMSFRVQRDLQPVTVLAVGEQVVVVNPGVPAKTLQELISLAKKTPGALNYASGGIGTAIHLGAELLNMRAGIDIKEVTYKGGGPAAAAVVSGEVQVQVGTVASVISFLQAGRLRGLATTGVKRSRLLPDLPTVAESGYPGFEASVWYALLVPAATPKNIAERLRVETVKALQEPDVQAVMARQGLEPAPSTPAELAARIRNESATWSGLIKKLGIRVE